MNENQIKEVLNGWFKLKQWSSHSREAKQFENTLEEFGSFNVYPTFQAFLQDWSTYLEDAEGNKLKIEEVLKNEENYKEFLELHFNLPYKNSEIPFKDLDKSFVFGKADGQETAEYFELVESINSEDELISFINEVLSDLGDVTHASGLKQKYEVVSLGGVTSPLSQVLSASEAEERWGLRPGTIRSACVRGKLKGHSGVRKSGSTWLITIDTMQKKYGEEKQMRTWVREGYKVVEKEFDFDLHEFDVIKGEEVIATITPATIEDMEQIIADLNNGEDVNGWEDGKGNTISI